MDMVRGYPSVKVFRGWKTKIKRNERKRREPKRRVDEPSKPHLWRRNDASPRIKQDGKKKDRRTSKKSRSTIVTTSASGLK